VKRKSRRLFLEHLEDRCTPTTFGNPWLDAGQLTLSFAPDGTQIGNHQSVLFKTLNAQVNANSAVWEQTILKAFQTWAVNANINIAVVPDGGQPFGTTGPIQGDTRFGDIRVGAYALTPGGELAFEEPFDASAGTWAGDLSLSSGISYKPGQTGSYDLFTVALHEAGHVFGLDHSSNSASVMYPSYQGPRTGLIAEDIARLQALYGFRQADGYDISGSDASFATARSLVMYSSTNPQPPTQADITTLGDADFYKINVGVGVGPFTVQVQTTGVSSLLPKVTVYDSGRHVVNSVVATDPMHGDISINVTPPLLSLLGSTYYVEVQGATSDVFGIGSYQVQAFPSLLSLGGLVNLVGDVVGGTLGTATLLQRENAQSDPRFDYKYNASITGSSDVDYFQFKSPTPPSGTANVMTAMLWATQSGGLDGLLSVYDSQGNPIAANILTHENGTTVVQIPNAAANATYYVSVAVANPSGTHATGGYFVGIDFGAMATNLQILDTDQTSTGGTATTSASTTLICGVDLLAHFVLSASGSSVPAGAAMEMDILDQNGKIVYSLIAAAGQTESLTCYLAQGQYTLSFKAINQNGGTVAPLLFTLTGIDLSDPINPYQSSPTSSPSGSSGTTSSSSTSSSSGSPSTSSPSGGYSSTTW
jgi:hypothetical protein